MTPNHPWRPAVLAAAVLSAGVLTFVQPRLAQWREYHLMADSRTLFGIPNALNVLSNVPFAIVGLAGLLMLFARRPRLATRRAYGTFFSGVALTAIGSAYYHLAPDNFRLVWDRLPMTVAFMGLLAAIAGERIHPRANRLLLSLVLLGATSVFYWYWSELRAAGDLRLYALVQFGSLAVIALTLLLYPGEGTPYFVAGLAAYAVSKIFEMYDAQLFSALRIVSGHTLKHLAAAAGAACVLGAIHRLDRSSDSLAAPLRTVAPIRTPRTYSHL